MSQVENVGGMGRAQEGEKRRSVATYVTEPGVYERANARDSCVRIRQSATANLNLGARGIQSAATSERIYRITKAALLKIMRRKPVDFDDLVQTAVERVLRSLKDGSFSGQCSLPTWVSVVASNVAIDWLRSSSRSTASLGFAEAEAVAPWPSRGCGPFEQQLEARSLLRVVTSLLHQMTSERREPLILHDVHGYDLNEVADMMNISVAAVQSRLVRARHRLRCQLEAAERACEKGSEIGPRRPR